MEEDSGTEDNRHSAMLKAVQNLDREIKNVNHLKRFSIGSMDMLVDPELEFRISNTVESDGPSKKEKRKSVVMLNTFLAADEPSNDILSDAIDTDRILSTDSFTDTKHYSVQNRKSSLRRGLKSTSYSYNTSKQNSLSKDENSDKVNDILWVRADQHPNVIPSKHLNKSPENLHVEDKKPSGNSRLSVRYNKKNSSIVRRPSTLRHSFTDENIDNDEEDQDSSFQTTNETFSFERDSIVPTKENHELDASAYTANDTTSSLEKSLRRLSLKNITDELTKLSTDAGLVDTDAISLAQSLGITSSFNSNWEDRGKLDDHYDNIPSQNLLESKINVIHEDEQTANSDKEAPVPAKITLNGITIPVRSSLRRSKFNTYRKGGKEMDHQFLPKSSQSSSHHQQRSQMIPDFQNIQDKTSLPIKDVESKGNKLKVNTPDSMLQETSTLEDTREISTSPVSDFQDIYDHYRQPSSDWDDEYYKNEESFSNSDFKEKNLISEPILLDNINTNKVLTKQNEILSQQVNTSSIEPTVAQNNENLIDHAKPDIVNTVNEQPENSTHFYKQSTNSESTLRLSGNENSRNSMSCELPVEAERRHSNDTNDGKPSHKHHYRRGGWAWFNTKTKDTLSSSLTANNKRLGSSSSSISDGSICETSNDENISSNRKSSNRGRNMNLFKSHEKSSGSNSNHHEKSTNQVPTEILPSSTNIKNTFGKFNDLFKRKVSGKSNTDIPASSNNTNSENGHSSSIFDLKKKSSISGFNKLNKESVMSSKSFDQDRSENFNDSQLPEGFMTSDSDIIDSHTTNHNNVGGYSNNLNQEEKMPDQENDKMSENSLDIFDPIKQTLMGIPADKQIEKEVDHHQKENGLQPAITIKTTKKKTINKTFSNNLQKNILEHSKTPETKIDGGKLPSVRNKVNKTYKPDKKTYNKKDSQFSNRRTDKSKITRSMITEKNKTESQIPNNDSNDIKTNENPGKLPAVSKLPLRKLQFDDVPKLERPNGPVEFMDSAFGFPLPLLTRSTIIMFEHRLAINIERAIYRLSHLKLSDPKKELRQQVLLSNFMYAYLHLVNHSLYLEQHRAVLPNNNLGSTSDAKAVDT